MRMHADQSVAFKPAEMPLAPFEVQYLTPAAFRASSNPSILGVIAYGAYEPDGKADYPVASTCLDPLDEACILEVWSSPDPVTYHHSGALKASTTERICFGSIEIEQGEGEALEPIIQHAYDTLLSFLGDHSFPAPIRFWNYLPFINQDDRGMERYRRFNIGRYDSFAARLGLSVPPVASALGVEVLDHRPARIRRPLDLIRLSGLVVTLAVLAAFGALASSTTTGANFDLNRLLDHIPRRPSTCSAGSGPSPC